MQEGSSAPLWASGQDLARLTRQCPAPSQERERLGLLCPARRQRTEARQPD